jgi:hypothetical protein
MTKEQLATIRKEMAAHAFDTSEYLRLRPLRSDGGKKVISKQKPSKVASKKK